MAGLKLERWKLDRQGYDGRLVYRGVGEKLWRYELPDGSHGGYVRGATKAEARKAAEKDAERFSKWPYAPLKGLGSPALFHKRSTFADLKSAELARDASWRELEGGNCGGAFNWLRSADTSLGMASANARAGSAKGEITVEDNAVDGMGTTLLDLADRIRKKCLR